ncbi:hypothetical protein Zmor_012054 [Zophobas morio]|uniref:Uncharacterized protein n=1 Tax=Zophobas morio TaxID=2755281 RepID=A0AA38HII0_9CUCU|nr:hypothetical protein Zmor_012054 [Zophobas morio]
MAAAGEARYHATSPRAKQRVNAPITQPPKNQSSISASDPHDFHSIRCPNLHPCSRSAHRPVTQKKRIKREKITEQWLCFDVTMPSHFHSRSKTRTHHCGATGLGDAR